jgi:AcrR family transcriptional regulator
VSTPKHPEPTPSRREQIVGAAVAVFSRYGYRRTSMELLAEAAGVSRPALYQHFRNKKDVLRGVAELIDAQMGAAARAAVGGTDGLADQLYSVLSLTLEIGIGVADAGHRQELIAEATALGITSASPLEGPLTDVLADVPGVREGAVTAREIAALLLDSTVGIGQSDDPPDVLRGRLRQLVDLTTRALDHGSGS